MEIIQMVLVLHLLTTSAILYTANASERREELIEDSVRRLLGFKPGTTKDSLPPVKNTTLPPRYMMDLYEKYRSGQTPMQGNTVRSILPMRDNMGEADVLIFNLTGLNPKEKILKSQIYILKRRKPRHGKRRDASHFRMKIGILPNMTFHRFIDVSLSRQKSDWQSYDITNSVVHCRRSRAENQDSLLGITLEIKRSRNNYRLVPFRRLLKQNYQPFLLIFSDDDNNQTRQLPKINSNSEYDAIQKLLRAKLDDSDSTESNDSSESQLARHKRFVSNRYSDSSSSKDNNSNFSYLSTNTRILDSLIDFMNSTNELSNDSYLFQKLLSENVIPQNSLNKSYIKQYFQQKSSYTPFIDDLPEVLQQLSNLYKPNKTNVSNNAQNSDVEHLISKRSISNKLSNSDGIKDGPDATAHTFQAVEEKHDDALNKTSKAHKNRKKLREGKRKKKRRRNRKLPFWWTKHDSRLHAQDRKKMCQRRSLVIDFTKLGWGDWIMSPKSFNAYYCTGGCSFHLIRNTNPSNHAALQSLVNALGLNPNIPTPCCVPSATSPLTLLYFDEHGSLVLKNYPNMIVEKCACR